MARAFRDSFRGLMSGVNTSAPGHVLSFDPVTQLADVKISVMISTKNGDIKHPTILMVPVKFSGGSMFNLGHQVDVGDEGMLVFSQRSIDQWIDQGGDSQQTIKRQFDIADAMFIPGLRSQPNKITGFVNDGIRMSSNDGAQYIWLKSDGTAEINVSNLVINGDITHTGNVVQTGDATVSGSVTAGTVDATTALTSAGKNITVHSHPAGNPPGTTGPNT